MPGASEPSEAVQRLALDAYPKWLRSLNSTFDLSKETTRFDQVAVKAQADIQESEFWKTFTAELKNIDDEYAARTTYKLVSGPEQYSPKLVRKPWQSFFEKTYRKNVLNNDRWPDPPAGGWMTPESWFERINDVVRTTMVVKYLDGVEFLVDRIGRTADQFAMSHRCDFEAKDAGYYAAHSYVMCEVDVPSITWDTEKKLLPFEVQVTTQLQDVIRRLTHANYENRRVELEPGGQMAWQWQYRSDQFVPNYLGHILHYLEGMIMEVRERQGGGS